MIRFSDVKRYIRGKELRISSDAKDVLIRIVTQTLDKAIEKARQDKRKTVKAIDIFP